jgi:hypothetical protein
LPSSDTSRFTLFLLFLFTWGSRVQHVACAALAELSTARFLGAYSLRKRILSTWRLLRIIVVTVEIGFLQVFVNVICHWYSPAIGWFFGWMRMWCSLGKSDRGHYSNDSNTYPRIKQ